MKKVAMWAFIFTVLGATSYTALTQARTGTLEAFAYHAGERYAVVLKKDVQVEVRRWYSRRTVTRTVRVDELCTISKGAYESVPSKHVSAWGRDYGLKIARVKARQSAQEAVRVIVEADGGRCKVYPRNSWRFFMYVGGGSVS